MFKRLFLTRNVAWWDRILRLIPAAIALWAYLAGQLNGPLAFAFGVVSAMLLVTSLTGTCSIYGMFGLSTLRKNRN
ncbi:MAG: DUF2892 domain-containing protein [Hyphomicrobiaceae bacterium]|nr:DUF2892 domain-containing protein [Hyphomicrobiaceae bacterium]MCC0023215.1 DUF2892 domain-containing protein [Hyphomicrobiaceae bacterium]